MKKSTIGSFLDPIMLMLHNSGYIMRKAQRKSGFTIVELLVVIVVIGILASISVVAYNGIQNRARASSLASALSQTAKQLIFYASDNNDSYPATSAAFFTEIGANSSGVKNDTTYQYSSNNTVSPKTYCVTATLGTVSYTLTQATSPTPGGCPGHAQGGQVAITNILANPSFESSLTGWTGSAATIARVSSPWSADGNSLQITPTGQDSYAQIYIPIEAGKTYTILGTIRIESPLTGTFASASQQRNIFPAFHTSSGTYIASGGGTTTPSPNVNGTYQQRITVTAPATTVQLRIRLYNGATSGGGVVYWDQIMAVEGTYSGAYKDGNSLNWVYNSDGTSTGPQ